MAKEALKKYLLKNDLDATKIMKDEAKGAEHDEDDLGHDEGEDDLTRETKMRGKKLKAKKNVMDDCY